MVEPIRLTEVSGPFWTLTLRTLVFAFLLKLVFILATISSFAHLGYFTGPSGGYAPPEVPVCLVAS